MNALYSCYSFAQTSDSCTGRAIELNLANIRQLSYPWNFNED